MLDKKLAVGYVRCSTEMQEDSPEQQKKEIERFATAQGIAIQEWYIDFGKSGTTFTQRSEFMRLKKVVESQPTFSTVICYDESRWGRAIDAEENTYWRVHFRKHGVEVLLVKSSIDPKHEFAPMLKAFEGVQASQYSKKLSELTLRGAASNGKFSSGGFPPYGYKRVGINLKTNQQRVLESGDWCVRRQEKVVWALGDPVEVDTVKFIFAERCKSTAYVVIAKILNDRGIPCARRGKWKNMDQKWSTGTIKSIIENPAYYGVRVYNRYSSSKIRAKQEQWSEKLDTKYPQWKLNKDRWVINENAHEAIVSRKTWDLANSHRRSEGRAPVRELAPYLLTGRITCARCGFAYQGQSTKTTGKKIYYRYICGGFNNKRVCGYGAVRRDVVESFVIGSIENILSDGLLNMDIEKQLKKVVELRPDTVKKSVSISIDRLNRVEAKIQNILAAIEDGTPSSMFADRLVQLQSEKRDIMEERDRALKSAERLQEVTDLAKSVRLFAENFRSIFESLPLHEKRQVIQKCLIKVMVDSEKKKAVGYFRKIPHLNQDLSEALDGLEKKQMAPVLGEPFRSGDVPGTGLEPAQPFGHRLLRPACLPISPPGHLEQKI